jgi:pimeloyl-ACP methyl ester carboxylesterase
LLAILLLGAGMSACATPVGVERVDVQTVHHELTSNVLSAGTPSAPTVQVLHRLGLFDRFPEEPDAVLAELHGGLAPTGDEARLFALAELSFLHGLKTRDHGRMFAAAAYAYAFLFPGEGGTAPDRFDPRLRSASDLYNRAVTGGFFDLDLREVVLAEGSVDLPFGSLEIKRAAPVFAWAGYELEHFESAADLRVRGLRNRYRQRGIGAPLAAGISSEFADSEPPPGYDRIPERLRVPATVLLRFESPRAGLARGRLRATLELYTQDDARRVSIDGRDVPLEFETTSSLALALEDPAIWEFESAAFLSGEFRPFSRRLKDGLALLRPYRPGRIPVVLVHGTASSPARWAELVNELENDPRLWERYQIWLFFYNTGNPVALSGAELREALAHALADLDPDGQDPALQRMVVIGHSQGGLLTKLTSIESGNRFWQTLSDTPIEELELGSETRELLQRSLFVEPLPFVKRLVFVCTPHRGSYLTVMRFAGLQPARWAAGLVQLPGTLASTAVDLVALSQDRKLKRSFEGIPTSIDNMTPGNPFLQALASLPVVPGVATHSIIAVQGDGPPEEGGDGVVRYQSAHIEGVESELVVRSGHSAQAQPETIEELRRILLEHAAEP